MIIRRNKFLTVLFSFLPGAGHMYMGFMKVGLSFMCAFAAFIALSMFFYTELFAVALPIIWFYSFFDCLNRMSRPGDAYFEQEDKFFFKLDELYARKSGAIARYRPYIGAALIATGIYMVLRNLFNRLDYLLIDSVRNALSNLLYVLPQFMVAGLIIFIGFKLISSKKKEVKEIEEAEIEVGSDV